MNLHKHLAVGIALAVAGTAVGAYAYFAGGTGRGTGTASVASATALTVAQTGTATGSMTPGGGSSVLTFRVTNPAAGHQTLTDAGVTVVADGATTPNVKAAGSPVTDCLASWFHATVTGAPSFPVDLAGGGHQDITVTVTMDDDDVAQDACQGITPDIELTVNG